MDLLKVWKDLPAIHTKEKTLSYQNLSQLVENKAKALEKGGVFSGDRVGLIAEKNIDTIVAFFALLYIGASPLMLSHRLPSSLIQQRLLQADASFFLSLPSWNLEKIGKKKSPYSYILLYTSGSTGDPKLALLSFEGMLYGAKTALSSLHLTQMSSWLLSVPLFHVSGLSILFRAIASGCSISFIEEKATHVSFVPTQLSRFLRGEGLLPSFKFLLVGGAPVSHTLLKCCQYPAYVTYGMTEMGSQVTMTTTDPLDGSGLPLPERELMLSPAGEVLVKGKMLFAGYDKQADPLTPDGWFPTGDLGSISPSGALYIKGRKDHMMISGGENIHPEEIERALLQIPGIIGAAVVPKEDKEFGQKPVAFIETIGPFPKKETLQELLAPLLPKFAIPNHFFEMPSIAKETKINKKDLIIEVNKIML